MGELAVLNALVDADHPHSYISFLLFKLDQFHATLKEKKIKGITIFNFLKVELGDLTNKEVIKLSLLPLRHKQKVL